MIHVEGAAEARDGRIAAIMPKRIVYLLEIVFPHGVVRVEDDEPVVLEAVFDAGEGIMIGLAEGVFLFVVVHNHLSPKAFGDFRGAVGAIVGDDEYRELFLRVIGFADAFDEPSDDVFLILAGDKNAIAALLFLGGE